MRELRLHYYLYRLKISYVKDIKCSNDSKTSFNHLNS